ncbi:hypothetical protein GCU67_06390 [Modestobacter muralis]|uniref:Uncharacterized protein n=1 Tax=Modestobacter muralis TaxID=1608614 RepID=A0A6P0ESV3_9ACTN|nr:hypothetical protein [Modestobacter muralis]NEK93806.1 hypothetical protein [Modestobacter muralis]NEN50573.1 hypothetical protein [Modestobacter muralis]
MSSPRDGDGDGFEDGRPAGWQEPSHLGGDPAPGEPVPGEPTSSDPAPRDATGPVPPGGTGSTGSTAADGAGWQPAGWDLPAVEPDRPGLQSAPAPAPAPAPWPADEPVTKDDPDAGRPRRGLGGLFGGRSRADDVPKGPADDDRPDDELQQPDQGPALDPTDPFGTLQWARQWGWVPSDGTSPQDAELVPLLQSSPVRPGREDRPSRVLRGRGDGLDLVAFDIASPVGRSWVSTHAVTAAPVLGAVPTFRLSPARLWRHGTAGMLQIPSPDPEFDRRWLLMAVEDSPQVRRLVADPLVRQSLLGTDDGDELWSAAGFVAAVRPDPNRPQLIEHHARLLAAIAGALAAAG